jgi:hypothetical protein
MWRRSRSGKGFGARYQVRLMLLCIAAISVPSAGQTAPANLMGTDFQSWDELDAFTRLTPKLDVTWIARVRLSEELPNPAHLVFGTDWNFSVSKYLVLTPSYYYGTYHTATGTIGHRQVPIFAVTPTFTRAGGGLSRTVIVLAGRLIRGQPTRRGSIAIVRASIIRYPIHDWCHLSLPGMRVSISPNTKAGRGTELRLEDAKNSPNTSPPTFITSAKITLRGASRLMSTRSQSWLSFVSDERVPKQALPGSRRYLSFGGIEG